MIRRAGYPGPAFIFILALIFFVSLEWAFMSLDPQDPQPRSGDTLALAFSMPIMSLDPYKFHYGAQDTLFPLIYSFLIVPLEKGGFAPDLAMRWWPDDEEKTWTFVLRPEAEFHDGRPVLASDAAYSVKRICESNSILNQALDKIEYPHPHRLVIRLKHRLPFFLYQLSLGPIVPRPRPGDKDLDQRPIGSGPFQVHFRDRDKRVVLSAFSKYFGVRPYLGAVDVRYIPDKEKIWIEFMTGQIQFCYAASPENIYFMRLEPDYYRLEGRIINGAVLLLFNNQDPVFSDLNVRRAVARALDVGRHIRLDLRGLAQPCPGPLGASSPFSPENAGPAPYDPEKVNQALKKAGWADHDQDMYRDRAGRDFDFNLLVPLTFQIERETGVYIQRALNQFGVRAHLVDKRYDRIINEDIRPGTFQACLTQQNTNPRLLHVLTMLWSSAGAGKGNFGRYKNERVDRALEELPAIDKAEDYAGPLREIHRQLIADQPAIWLYHKHEIHAYSRRLQGLDRPCLDFYLTFPFRRTWLVPRQDLAH